MDVRSIHLPSGLQIHNPLEMLQTFCREEYDYYDAIPSMKPNEIDPLDVLVTVSMNSYIQTAGKVRQVHQDLASNCNHLLSIIPEDADLLSYDNAVDVVGNVLKAALNCRNVLVPVATKVLHRKRRHLIPMLDNVVMGYYLHALGKESLAPATQDKARAADVACTVLSAFRDDLVAVAPDINGLVEQIARSGYSLTHVRILELLVWIAKEQYGYYRGDSAKRARTEAES